MLIISGIKMYRKLPSFLTEAAVYPSGSWSKIKPSKNRDKHLENRERTSLPFCYPIRLVCCGLTVFPRDGHQQTNSLFGWLVADGWCWFVLREEYCWLVLAGCWWLVCSERKVLLAGG
jgi:hypothetical protein